MPGVTQVQGMPAASELEKLQFLFNGDQFSLASDRQEVSNRLSQELQSLDSVYKGISLQEMNETKAKTEDNIRILKPKISDKENELEKLQTESEKKFKSYRYEEKLYYKITKTTFELNPLPDTVAGFCAAREIKTFQLNEKENSEFHITNHLWGLLDKPE